MVDVTLVRTIEQLERLAKDWDRLAQGAWMRSYLWHSCWVRHYAGPAELRVLVARRGTEVIGIMPMLEERRILTGRTLVWTGSGKVCTDDLGILVASEDQEVVTEAFAQTLVTGSAFAWDYCDLDGVRDEDPSMTYLNSCLMASHAMAFDRMAGPRCWKLALCSNASGQVVWPKRLRGRMKQGQRELADGTCTVDLAGHKDEALRKLLVIQQMHQTRWQNKGQPGCFADDRFTRFLTEYVTRRWDEGGVRILTLRWQGLPAAGLVGFQSGNTLHLYLTAMADEFAEHNPGWKLHGFAAENALREGCNAIDYMRGDEEYKQRLGAVPATQGRWLMASPKLSGQVRRTLYQTAREIKSYWGAAASPPVFGAR